VKLRAPCAGHNASLDGCATDRCPAHRAGLPMACIAVIWGRRGSDGGAPRPGTLDLGHARDLTRSPAAKIATVNVSPALGASPAIVEALQHAGRDLQAGLLHVARQGLAVRFGFLAPKPSGPATGPPAPRGRTRFDDRHGHVRAFRVDTRVIPSFLPMSPVIASLHLISTSTRRANRAWSGRRRSGPRIQNVDHRLCV